VKSGVLGSAVVGQTLGARPAGLGHEVKLGSPRSGQARRIGVTGDAPTMFIAGDDDGAKREVTGILESFGWSDVVDLGELRIARYLEPLGMVWVTYWARTEARNHTVKLIGGRGP
jgi:predicted dinucleotide-binding enzyme